MSTLNKLNCTFTASYMLAISSLNAFCGFYVAKTDASLVNKASQVIVVRHGERNTITMQSDFEGDVNDFAMVVPVPVVLKRNDIRVKERNLFDRFNDYSAPRMAEYYDEEPCYDYNKVLSFECYSINGQANVKYSAVDSLKDTKSVKIEARYKVEEYDILILSATESSGLKTWLTQNNYRIPERAEEVLAPYIKSNMKFFVVKVDLNVLRKRNPEIIGNNFPLRPIQISFESPKFMLPIRLGMANAKTAQDMIVYMLTASGRVETTNYRTVKIPSNKDVPVFVANEFTSFYKKLYSKSLNEENRKAVFLEYAWDVSPQNPVKCDPCVGTPLYANDLRDAGVDWFTESDVINWKGSASGNGVVYFTRLHVTYDRWHYPQDLQFQETPNRENFQARYVRHIPPQGSDFSCYRGQKYLRELRERRLREVNNYALLTGESMTPHLNYISEYDHYLQPLEQSEKENQSEENLLAPLLPPNDGGGNSDKNIPLFLLSLATLMIIVFTLSRRNISIS